MSDPNEKAKRRQRMLVLSVSLGILLLIGAGMVFVDTSRPVTREKPSTVSLTPPGSADDKEVWRAAESARAKRSETAIAEMQTQLQKEQDERKRLTAELEALKTPGKGGIKAGASGDAARGGSYTRIGEELNKPLPDRVPAKRLLNDPSSSSTPAGPGATAPTTVLNSPVQRGTTAPTETAERGDDDGLIVFSKTAAAAASPQTAGATPRQAGVADTAQDTPARDEGATRGIEFLPAGSFVRVTMLNGLDAPTGGQAQGNPLPVAFQVLDSANLANHYRMNIKDCRVIAAAWGDLSSERTMGRAETLTCIVDGSTVEIPIKGWVIGEDGKAGVRGRLVTKQGQLLANALLSGGLAGIGRAFQAAATTTTTGSAGVTQAIDGDKVTQAAIGGGVGSAANMLAQYYLKAADKLYPVIETDGGRVVEILITKGAVYTGTPKNEAQYRRLLRRAGGTARSEQDD